MVKYTNLSPRDIETFADNAKTKIINPSLNLEIDGEKIIKKPQESKTNRLLSIGNNRRKKSFKKTMNQVREQLPLTKRLFSTVIHNNAIEKLSSFFGETVLRPKPILLGAVLAFIITLFNYILVKQYNYVISGYESIVAFTFGWLVGIIYDYLTLLITGKR